MGPKDDDIAWLQTRLTVARWHLDAALAAPIERARRNIDRARQAYDEVCEALEDLNLPAERRAGLVHELARLRDRLQSAGAEI
ncbi:MAG: hypothetical protein ACREUG_09350 [Steroidobacteraceae bacterium]